MPLNSAILPRRWLKENKFINNSSNVIFTSDECFCQNKKIKNWDILHLLSSFAWSNRLLSVFNSVFSLSDVSCCCLKSESEENHYFLTKHSFHEKASELGDGENLLSAKAFVFNTRCLNIIRDQPCLPSCLKYMCWVGDHSVGWAIIGLYGITSICSVDCLKIPDMFRLF